MATQSQIIQQEIENRRSELSRDLDLLQDKVRTATDWRAHFQHHPWIAMGAAAGIGILLSRFLGRRTGIGSILPGRFLGR